MHRSMLCSSRAVKGSTTATRSYRPKPAHPLKGARPAPERQVQNDPHVFRNHLTSLLPAGATARLTDTAAMQIFTHKSLDHGVSPYNSKLAHLGRRSLYHFVCAHLASRPSTSASAIAEQDISALYKPTLTRLLAPHRQVAVAEKLGLTADLLRWLPSHRTTPNLQANGFNNVQVSALEAIVGWTDLAAGPAVARQFCEEKVIPVLLAEEAAAAARQ